MLGDIFPTNTLEEPKVTASFLSTERGSDSASRLEDDCETKYSEFYRIRRAVQLRGNTRYPWAPPRQHITLVCQSIPICGDCHDQDLGREESRDIVQHYFDPLIRHEQERLEAFSNRFDVVLKTVKMQGQKLRKVAGTRGYWARYYIVSLKI